MEEQAGNNNMEAHHDISLDPVTLTKVVKQFKMHRCALDFDTALCKAVIIDFTAAED